MNITIKKTVSTVTAVLLAGVVLAACSRDTANKIVIKGSTTVLPITQKAAEKYRELNKVSITIEGSGSGNGIKALLDGTCSIANSSREMREQEIATAKEKGVAVREIPVAIDMIVPVVNPVNPVDTLTMDQLKGIYDGSIKNWKQVGGKDEKIVVISRDSSSGTYEIWHEKVMHKTDVARDALLQASNGAIVSAVAGNPKAIGYIGFGYIDRTVKPISVSGVLPTLENGKTGKFPVSRKLYMYINEKKVSDETRKFIDFLLGGDGQRLVTEAGFISINK